MFIHTMNVDRNLLTGLRRTVDAQVSELVLKSEPAPPAVAESVCEDGVCVLAWHPQRPAA